MPASGESGFAMIQSRSDFRGGRDPKFERSHADLGDFGGAAVVLGSEVLDSADRLQLTMVRLQVEQDLKSLMRKREKDDGGLLRLLLQQGRSTAESFLSFDFMQECLNTCWEGPSGFPTTADLCKLACQNVMMDMRHEVKSTPQTILA